MNIFTSHLVLPIIYSSFIFLGTRAVDPNAHCYTGNGTVVPDRPCDLTKDVSFCCGVGWSCLSNGLCQFKYSTSFAEGTCTDTSFPANACLGLCLASRSLWFLLLEKWGRILIAFVSTGGNDDQTLVHDCGGSGDGDTNSWCCAGEQGTTGQGQDCCSTNATTTLPSFPYSTITVITAASTSSSNIFPIILSSSSSSAHKPSSISQLTTSSHSSRNKSPTSTERAPAIVTQNSKPVDSPSHDSSHSLAIGAGVGVPLGTILFVGLIILLYRMKSIKRQMIELRSHMSKAQASASEQDIAKTPLQVSYELETGIDRGELSAGHMRHEMPERM